MKKVVIIEDNLVVRHLLSSWFADDDFEVLTFDDIENLNERMDLIKPDLIITDIMLPNTNAAGMIEYFTKVKYPVIILSSMEEEDINYFANKIGAVAFFKKPVNLNSIFGFVNEYFHGMAKD